MSTPSGGYGVDPEELEQLRKTLNGASDALDMTDLPSKCP
jgi:hypothetical protein